MTDKERLVQGIIKFLADEAASDAIGEEAKESIEGMWQSILLSYGY